MSGKRKPLLVAALAVGWVVVASSTAGAIVALGKHHTTSQAAALAALGAQSSAAASAPPATPTASGSSSSSAPATTTGTTTVPPTTTAPKPTSTVTGKVASGGSVHTGDVRFFLLPVPAGGSVVGDQDGKVLSKDDVVQLYGGGSDVRTTLNVLHFKDGANRDYQTVDGAYNVEVTLYRFDNQADAAQWWQLDEGFKNWTKFTVAGFPSVKAQESPKPTSAGDLQHLRAYYYKGDTVFEIIVNGAAPIDTASITDPVKRELDHLTTGA